MFLISLPYSELDLPPAAPPILKGIAEAYGYTIKTHDFSVDLQDAFGNDPDLNFLELMNSWMISTGPDWKFNSQMERFYDHVIETIKNTPCRFLGISVFSGFRHKAVLEVCQRIREVSPDIKIVLGGKGLSLRYYMSIENYLTPAEKMLTFDKIMLKRKLADYIINGDAEDAIIDLLSGKMDTANLDRHVPTQNNLEYPFSNFDDCRFDKYSGHAGKYQLPVVSSKGCVRNCDFCDVEAHFGKFQSKNGKRLAEEMIFLSKKYRIYEFAFVDSIANGNMKSLREACHYLADYNETVAPEERIKWAGNWISRPPGNIKPDFFDLMAKSGCISLVIGAETGSNRVLELMNKKTTVEGLYYELEHINRVGIQVALNNITAHWSEEFDDFLDTIDMFLNLGPYTANKTITGFSLGPGFHVLDNTPASNVEHSGIITNQTNFDFVWHSTKNPNLTIKARAARIYLIYKLCLTLNIAVTSGYYLNYLYESLIHTKDKFVEFYNKHLDKKSWKPCHSLDMLDSLDLYIDSRLKVLYPTTTLKMSVRAQGVNSEPRMFIKYNDITYFYDTLADGVNNIELTIPYVYDKTARLEIGMDNKDKFDTVIDDNGNILVDKSIIFEKVEIDKIDIMKNLTFYYGQANLVIDGVNNPPTPGLFTNGSIVFDFNAPFWTYYIKYVIPTFEYEMASPYLNFETLKKLRDQFITYEY